MSFIERNEKKILALIGMFAVHVSGQLHDGEPIVFLLSLIPFLGGCFLIFLQIEEKEEPKKQVFIKGDLPSLVEEAERQIKEEDSKKRSFLAKEGKQ